MLAAAYQQRARVPLFVPKMALFPSAWVGGIRGRGLRAGTHGLGKRRGDRASCSYGAVCSIASHPFSLFARRLEAFRLQEEDWRTSS